VTLIELMVVISVLSLIVAGTATGMYTYSRGKALEAATRITRSVLEDAHARTLGAENNSQFGVHFASSSNTVTLFQGGSYSASDPNNEETTLNSYVEIVALSLNGGGNEVVFDRLVGTTDTFGSISLRLASGALSTSTITISRSGLIE